MGEYALIQVFTPYDNAEGTIFDGRFLDYSRCTPAQAREFMADKDAAKWRVVHWIYKDELTRTQLDRMIRDDFGQFAERPPTDGDYWSVTVQYDTGADGIKVMRASVDTWTGMAWEQLVLMVADQGRKEGWDVKSVQLGD